MKVKNKIKQILSIIVTAMMMMSLFTVNAFATAQSNGFDPGRDKGTITVKKPSSAGETSTAKYKAYQILTATEKPGTNSIYEYDVTFSFQNLIGDGDSVPYKLTAEGKIIKKDGNVVVNDPTVTNNTAKEEFARAVEAYINNNDVESTATEEFAIGIAKEVNIGYYAVLQTKADSSFIQSLPIVVDVPHITYNATAPNSFNYEYEIDIETKIGGVPTVDKKIVEGESRLEKNDVSIGDTVTYEITSTIPKYTEGTNLDKVSYYLTDTLSSGLTFGSVTSVVAKGTNKSDLILDKTKYGFNNADNTITFSFNNDNTNKFFDNIKDYDKVVITYTATLNENAIIGSTGNPNKVKLTYTNNPATGSTTETTEITVVTYTYKVDVVKQDSVTDSKKLAGAEFKLQKKGSDNEYSDVAKMYILKDGKNVLVGSTPEGGTETIKAETAADGTLVFTGLDEGSYRLVETKAPEGYVLPANASTDFTITASKKDGNYTISNVSGNNSSVDSNNVITIKNVKGVNLPQTGGAGTWMFTIGGLVLMAGAVVVFMATRKKKAN